MPLSLFRRRTQDRKTRGFTLIELLVVIAIIGLLSTLAVVALNSSRAKARDAKRVADVKQVQNALELFFNEANGYPYTSSPIRVGGASARSLCKDATATVSGSTFKSACGPTDTTFIGVAPAAAVPADGACDSGQNDFMYDDVGGAVTNFGTGYTISFCLGSAVGDLGVGGADGESGWDSMK